MVVGVKDVASRAGVSVGTVSNAMNHPEKVSPETLERINAAIADLGYSRNDAARQLREGRSRTIGMVVLDVRNPFFTEVARGAEDAAADAGLTVMLGNSDESPDREATYLDLFEQQRVAGILISPYGEIDERLAGLADRGIRSALVDRVGDGSVSSVSVDDVAGGRMAVEHLLAQGRRRVVFVGGPTDIRQVQDRLEGARLAIATHPEAGLEVLDTAGATVLAGRAAGQEILGREMRPDAVFAANDLLAMGLLQAFALQGAGVRVPQDIALIGYDDIDFAAAAVVPLSSIRQPAQLIGRTAVEMLLAGGPPEQVVFQPELVVRDSTA